MRLRPLHMVAIGFLLVLFGFLSIFLMVIRVIEASFFLSFLGYGASFGGLLLGLAGLSLHTLEHRD